jgi:hypothetical protein
MPHISTVRLVLKIPRTSLPVTPPLAPLSIKEGEIPWCSLWEDTLYSIQVVWTECLEFLDMTRRISPGGSGVGLVPLAALIKRSDSGPVRDQLTSELLQLYLLGPLHRCHQMPVTFHLEMLYEN